MTSGRCVLCDNGTPSSTVDYHVCARARAAGRGSRSSWAEQRRVRLSLGGHVLGGADSRTMGCCSRSA